MQADPYKASGHITDPQSWNRYSYTRNNPSNRVDSLGLDDDEVWTYPPESMNVNAGSGSSASNGSTTPGVTGDPNVSQFLSGNESGESAEAPPPDTRDDLLAAYDSLGIDCRKKLEQDFKAWIKKYGNEVTILKWTSDAKIPKAGNRAYNTNTASGYWASATKGRVILPGAMTVNYLEGNETHLLDSQKYKTIILGPAFYDPNLDGIGKRHAKGNDDLYRQMVLMHEMLHMVFDRDDEGLFKAFELDKKGYTGVDKGTYSNGIQEWISTGCPEQRKQ
jgi:hypothetical protein